MFWHAWFTHLVNLLTCDRVAQWNSYDYKHEKESLLDCDRVRLSPNRRNCVSVELQGCIASVQNSCLIYAEYMGNMREKLGGVQNKSVDLRSCEYESNFSICSYGGHLNRVEQIAFKLPHSLDLSLLKILMRNAGNYLKWQRLDFQKKIWNMTKIPPSSACVVLR